MKGHNGLSIIGMILAIIIIIAILSVFNISIRTFVEKKIVRENFGYVWEWMKYFWGKYLECPAKYSWDTIVKYIWEPFIDAMERIRNRQNPKMMENAPQAPILNPQ